MTTRRYLVFAFLGLAFVAAAILLPSYVLGSRETDEPSVLPVTIGEIQDAMQIEPVQVAFKDTPLADGTPRHLGTGPGIVVDLYGGDERSHATRLYVMALLGDNVGHNLAALAFLGHALVTATDNMEAATWVAYTVQDFTTAAMQEEGDGSKYRASTRKFGAVVELELDTSLGALILEVSPL